jgi:hypothetical protein
MAGGIGVSGGRRPGPASAPLDAPGVPAGCGQGEGGSVHDLLRAIRDELQLIRGVLERQPRRRPSRAALLPILAATVRDRAFNAVEVINHAEVDPVLRAALDRAGLETPQQLGKVLRAWEARPVRGHRLERLGRDSDGVIWRCVSDG